MASSMFLDPLQVWRDTLTKLEHGVNSALTDRTRLHDVMRALHQFSSTSLGMQRFLDNAIREWLRQANLPTRNEVLELAESLRRIEDKLDRLLPTAPAASALRPARTRRPPAAAAKPVPLLQPATAHVAAPRRSERDARSGAARAEP